MIKQSVIAIGLSLVSLAASAEEIELPRSQSTAYGYFAQDIAPGVTVLHQAGEFHIQPRGNVTIIEQATGYVLVDSGGSQESADQIVALISQKPDKPLKAVILTHWHGDHVLGVSRLLEKWPAALIIGTPATRDILADAKTDRFMPGADPRANATFMKNIDEAVSYLEASAKDPSLSPKERAGFAQAVVEYRQYGQEMKSARRMPPRVLLENTIVLKDDERPIEIHFFGRANTAGDAIVWLPRQRVVVTGDVVVAPIPFGFNTYPSEWIQVLERIRALKFSILVPGHGRPLHDTTLVDRFIAMLKDVRAQVSRFAHDTTPASDVVKRIDLKDAETAIAGNDPWLRRWFRAYWRDPIISSALREARGQPVIQGED